jgi:hypothetical protein
VGHLCSVKQAAGDDRAAVKIESHLYSVTSGKQFRARNNAIEPEYTLLNSVRYQELINANARTKRQRTLGQDLLLSSVRLFILVQV